MVWKAQSLVAGSSPMISPVWGFQHKVRLSFPQDRRRSASCRHQETDSTPFECPLRIYTLDTGLKTSRILTYPFWSSSVSQIPKHDNRTLIVLRGSDQPRRLFVSLLVNSCWMDCGVQDASKHHSFPSAFQPVILHLQQQHHVPWQLHHRIAD